jgi:hypothetical protein
MQPLTQTSKQVCLGLLCVAGLVSTQGWTSEHNFHFSRTDIHWRESTHTLQTTIRVFTDDLERSLDGFRRSIATQSSSLEGLPPLRLGDEREWELADTLLHAWVKNHLTCTSQKTPILWRWVGKEVELDVTYLHVESERLPHQPVGWFIENQAFMELFEDQVNEIHVHALCGREEVERREMLDIKVPAMTWFPCQVEGSKKQPKPRP